MGNLTILIKYSCFQCGVFRRSLNVAARTPGEDVLAWTNRTVAAVAADHRADCPACRATSVSELMIPMQGASLIGGPVER